MTKCAVLWTARALIIHLLCWGKTNHFAAKEFEQDTKIPCSTFDIKKKVGKVRTNSDKGYDGYGTDYATKCTLATGIPLSGSMD